MRLARSATAPPPEVAADAVGAVEHEGRIEHCARTFRAPALHKCGIWVAIHALDDTGVWQVYAAGSTNR